MPSTKVMLRGARRRGFAARHSFRTASLNFFFISFGFNFVRTKFVHDHDARSRRAKKLEFFDVLYIFFPFSPALARFVFVFGPTYEHLFFL